MAQKEDNSKLEATHIEADDYSVQKYGDKKLCQSSVNADLVYISICDLKEEHISKELRIKGFLQHSRNIGKQVFLVVRQKISTVQCVTFVDKSTSSQMVKFISNIPQESLIEVKGLVSSVSKPVAGCSKQNIEIRISELFVVSRAKTKLPLQIQDAMQPEGDDGNLRVTLDQRLNNRVLDLRTPTNQAIFKIQASVKQYFADFLNRNGFTEISPPCMLSGASEGGATVFKFNYFNQEACLAQSPQLYKQMAIVSGFERVFARVPVFRAENSLTHRHLTEFNGLDIEMAFNSHYHEVLNMICQTLIHIFKSIEDNLKEEIAIIGKQYVAEPFKFVEPTPILTFAEGIEMLRNEKIEINEFEDLSTKDEKSLGKLVKQKFGTDFYVLDRYPLNVRPFYTMPDPNDERYSNSYDIFMRGEEIMSGAQRIHDAALLRKRAEICGINLETIKDYLESFEYGCSPHAGGGIGLERVVMLYLGINNIRNTSLFPRDPKRLRP